MNTNKIFDKKYTIKKESGYQISIEFIKYEYDCVELRISKYLGGDNPNKPMLDVTSGVMLARKDFKALFCEFADDLKEFIDGTDVK